MQAHEINQTDAKEFILGGHALFTIKSKKTGKRFTYKVNVDSHNKGILNVYVLNGPDNTRNYKKFGYIGIDSNMQVFRPGPYDRDKDFCTAFDHVFLNLCISLYMPDLEIWHEGRCCRCGRVLTVPESIERGIGPECITREKYLKINYL